MIERHWVATCARGLEPLLLRELADLGIGALEADVGGVRFQGRIEDAVRACWRLRTANRVLLELAHFAAQDPFQLYRGIVQVFERHETDPFALSALASPDCTIAFRATTQRSRLRDSRWVALRAKDALVDAQRKRFGKRSSVAPENPHLPLRIRLVEDRATLLLDIVGQPLDRRHYRMQSVAAPLRETLAAALPLAADLPEPTVVLDPMCGSGTLLAEAASYYLGIPPLRLRSRWLFEQWPEFSAALAKVQAELLPVLAPQVRILGWDRDPNAIEIAQANLQAAGLAARIELEVADAFERSPPKGRGLLLINPPFGHRLEADAALWKRLGDWLKTQCSDWRAVLLAGDPSLVAKLGLRPAKRLTLRHGPLDARIVVLDVIRGRWKDRPLASKRSSPRQDKDEPSKAF